MRILIAEDDCTSRNILTAVLKKLGHEVIVTRNGLEAWDALRQPAAPPLVILDWMMPGLDGAEVCRRLRTLKKDLSPHIIMLTTREGKADIIAGLEAGADDYLPKPYDPGELCARINVGRRMIELQTNLLATRNALEHAALHDPLTGILNRRAILDVLSRELSRVQRQNTGLSVGICDIDHFKQVNDTHGHLVGDEVICGFVRLLKRGLRPYDHLGRFGGEEFVIMASDIKENDVNMLYERLRAAIADNPIPTKVGNVSITVCIGVAVWSGSETGNNLLAAADSALYQAKNTGRNRMCLAVDGFVESEQPREVEFARSGPVRR